MMSVPGLASLPISASWFIGSVMTIAMYGIWLKDSAEHIHGQTNIGGYQQAAVVCGAVILASLVVLLRWTSSGNPSSS